MDLIEKTVKSEQIYNGAVVDLRVDTVVLPDGKEAKREVIHHPGGVCIVAVDDNNNVLLVKQFRNPAQQVLLEIPAGKLEYGEDPLEAGMRELEEETGVVADEFVFMGCFYPLPAYSKEKIYMYFARNLKQTKQHLDDDEFLVVEKMHFDKLLKKVANGEIIDGKTALALLRAKEYINK